MPQTSRLSALLPVLTGALVLACGSMAASCPGEAATQPAGTPFDAERAWKHLEAQVAFGPRPSGSEAIEKTRAYLESELKAAGLTPVREAFKEMTPAGEIEFANVYADLPSEPAGGPLIIIGSHFDTKRFEFVFVGANDSASSTGVLLELARVIAAGGPRAVTYRFLFLDGEESVRPEWRNPDNRYGSRYHAEQLKKTGAVQRVKAFVLLDLVGDKDLRLRQEEFSDAWLREMFFAAARKNGLGKHVDGKREPAYDDHISFVDIGVPSVDLIDFDYGPNNAWWHSAEDTLDKVSKASLDVIGRIVLLGLPAVEERARAK